MASVTHALVEAARRNPVGLQRAKRDPTTRHAALVIEALANGRSSRTRGSHFGSTKPEHPAKNTTKGAPDGTVKGRTKQRRLGESASEAVVHQRSRRTHEGRGAVGERRRACTAQQAAGSDAVAQGERRPGGWLARLIAGSTQALDSLAGSGAFSFLGHVRRTREPAGLFRPGRLRIAGLAMSYSSSVCTAALTVAANTSAVCACN